MGGRGEPTKQESDSRIRTRVRLIFSRVPLPGVWGGGGRKKTVE